MKPIRKPVNHIDRKNGLVWVTGKHGAFPCKVTRPVIAECVMLGDDVSIVKSAVTGEWLCVDYHIDTPTNYAIHNSYQEELPEAERDYCYNERGELYE